MTAETERLLAVTRTIPTETKRARILQAMNETERLLEKAMKRYNDSVTCLKMEIAENAELANKVSANRPWIDYCNQDKARANKLRAHMDKLNDMLAALA